MPVKSCICEICTCGRHKCPVHPKVSRFLGDDKECKITEYSNKYRAYDVTGRPQNFKPVPQIQTDGLPLDDATTFKSDYIQHPLQPKFNQKGGLYAKPAGEMDLRSSYVNDYPEKSIDKTASLKPTYNYNRGDIPFEGNPTYKDDYKQWKCDKTEAVRKDKMYMPPTAQMERETTFRTDFVPRDIPYTKSFKPDSTALVNKEPFDDLTNHKMNYICHPLPEKVFVQKEEYRPSKRRTSPILECRLSLKHDTMEAAENNSCKCRLVTSYESLRVFALSPHVFSPEISSCPYREFTEMMFNNAKDATHGKLSTSMDATTEYTNRYRKFDLIARPQGFKPVPQIKTDDVPLDVATTFRTDYIQHPLQQKLAQKVGIYCKPAGEMDLRSSYVNDYPEKNVDKTGSLKPTYNYDRGDIPFEGNPTYKEDYKQWKCKKLEAIKKDKMYLPPTVQMERETTFGTDYIQRDIPYTKSFKPDNTALVNREPFDDLTNNKMIYVCHPLPEKIAIQKETYQSPKVPLEGVTTAQRDYIGYQIPKQESFKPKNSGLQSDQPLDDMTEFRECYKQWNIPKRDTRVRDAYVKPPGLMDSTTSHRNDYIQHQVQPARSMKPQQFNTGADIQFDDSTTFKIDYKPWQANHERRSDPSRKPYELPSVPFDGLATYKAHYVEHGLNPVKSYKPDNFVDANRAPFEGNTIYKAEYVPKHTEACPVTELPRHGYRFVETNTQGHQVYAK